MRHPPVRPSLRPDTPPPHTHPLTTTHSIPTHLRSMRAHTRTHTHPLSLLLPARPLFVASLNAALASPLPPLQVELSGAVRLLFCAAVLAPLHVVGAAHARACLTHRFCGLPFLPRLFLRRPAASSHAPLSAPSCRCLAGRRWRLPPSRSTESPARSAPPHAMLPPHRAPRSAAPPHPQFAHFLLACIYGRLA